MDSRLLTFLGIIRDILINGGADYHHPKFKYSCIGASYSINYAALLKKYGAVKEFLRYNSNSKQVKTAYLRCMIETPGDGISKSLQFQKDSLDLIETIINENLQPHSSPFTSSSTQTDIVSDDAINQSDLPCLASFKLNTQFTTINQSKLKQNYNSNYVQQVYRERGFQELEEALKNFLSYEGWNNELKKNCVDKLIKNLQQANNSDIVMETYSDYMNVCSSIKSFIAGLDQSSQSKRAQDYITVACGYENNLSSRRLAMIIGVDRDRIDRLKRGINDYLVEEAAAVNEEPDDHILDDEPPLSDDNSWTRKGTKA